MASEKYPCSSRAASIFSASSGSSPKDGRRRGNWRDGHGIRQDRFRFVSTYGRAGHSDGPHHSQDQGGHALLVRGIIAIRGHKGDVDAAFDIHTKADIPLHL